MVSPEEETSVVVVIYGRVDTWLIACNGVDMIVIIVVTPEKKSAVMR